MAEIGIGTGLEAPAPHKLSVEMRVALLCTLVGVLDGMDNQTIAYAAPSIARSWSIPVASLGPVFGIGLFGLMLGAFLLAPLADRIGRRIVIIGSTTLFGLASLLTALVPDLPEMMLLRFVTGIGLGGAMPNVVVLTNEFASPTRKSLLVSIMFSGFPLGSTLGGIVSLPLMSHFGWHSIFVLGGILPLALVPALLFFLPESPRFVAGRKDPAAAAGARGGLGEWGGLVTTLFSESRARSTMLLWVAFFMNLLVMFSLVNWLPALVNGRGLPLSTAVIATSFLHLGGLVGGLGIGWLLERFRPFGIVALAYFLGASFIVTLAVAGRDVPLLLTAAFLSGICVTGAQIGLNAATANFYPESVRATGIGWALAVGRLGAILGPVVGGLLLGLGWNSRDLLLLTAVPASLAALSVTAIYRINRAAVPSA